jgi:hypothetical protein
MLLITGALIGAVAVLAVALEATGPAIVLGRDRGVDDRPIHLNCTGFFNGSPLAHRTLF